MIIDINQQKVAIADKYRISINGQEVYRAARKLWRIFAEVDLFYRDEGEPRLTIKKRLSFFKPSYVIFVGGDAYRFTTRNFWKHVYLCDIGADHYEVYAHRGRKYSIFCNDRQVAWWDKDAVSVLAGDHYVITAADDADAAVLVAFCLIIDNYRSDEHDDKLVNYDVGNLLQAKKFDPYWQPRSRK